MFIKCVGDSLNNLLEDNYEFYECFDLLFNGLIYNI